MLKKYGRLEVDVDDNGYLTDRAQWNREIAEMLAGEASINLTAKHWVIIEYLQKQFDLDIEMTIRKLGTSGLADVKELYELFPPSPLKTASKIAGLPLPKTCV